MLAKRQKHYYIDIDYREYNWSSNDEISIIILWLPKKLILSWDLEKNLNLTERLIQIGNTDHQVQNIGYIKMQKIVVIKHGQKGVQCFFGKGQFHAIKPFPVKSRKGFGGGDGYASAFLYGVFKEWNHFKMLRICKCPG